MRKPIYVLFFLIIISLLSCGQNSSEKRLNGKWYEIENEYNIWHFFPDSLVFPNLGEKFEWQATDLKIKFDLITYVGNLHEKNIDYEDKIVIDYKINKNNDSLFGKLKNKYGKHKFSLLKAENYIEYLNKKFGIGFSLPKNNSVEKLNRSNNHGLSTIYGLKVFLGYSDNKIIGRTELSENLNNLKSDIKTFKDSIKPYEHPRNSRQEISNDEHKRYIDQRFHFRVFADKNVSDSTITKYLSVNIEAHNSSIKRHYEIFNRNPPDSIPIKIYRIFNSNEEINPWNIKGKEIKTIANRVDGSPHK